MAQHIVMDTDPGIDDSLAILLALASPEVELAAVSVTGGNCSLPCGVRNALSVLALAGRSDLLVHAGVALPLLRPAFTAPETHGDTGLGYARLPDSPVPPSDEHGVDMLIREIMAQPGEVTLVALAPLTNVALAIRKEPRIVEAVREVIIMGGALRVDGNTTPLAEFNFYVDPHAAQIVLTSGMPITLMPWDICKDVLLTQADVDQLLANGSPISRFVADATRFYIEFHREYFDYAGCSICDPAALALALDGSLGRTEMVNIYVEHTSELTMGKSVADWGRVTGREPNVRAVVEFDSARFIRMFVERLERLVSKRSSSEG
jgi:purine nucleosidase